MGIPILKIRQSWDRLIFSMGIPILVKWHQYYILRHPHGPDSVWMCHLTSIGSPIVGIRWSYDRLISTVGFLILVRWHFCIESAPRTSSSTSLVTKCIHILRSKQNGCHVADNIFWCLFVNESNCIFSLSFVPQGPIDNNAALVQIMARHPKATSHYLKQWWLNSYRCISASPSYDKLTHLPLVLHICQWTGSPLAQIMACCLFCDKPLSKPMLRYS